MMGEHADQLHRLLAAGTQAKGEPLLIEHKMLDHGYVRYVNHMGNDLTPLEAARMSTDKETGVDVEADDRLRERLWRDLHTTPFEQCELVVELQLPIFCLRQIDRHRTVARDETIIEVIETIDETMHAHTTRNEFSGRYSTMPDLFYIPAADRVRKKGTANKQGSSEPLAEEQQREWSGRWAGEARHARVVYEEAVATGMASELARIHLPLNQYTKLRLKACLLNWLKFLNLRLRPDVQWETRLYAQAIGRICRVLWPKTWAVFEEHSLYSVRLSRTERQLLLAVLPGGEGVKALLAKLADPGDFLEVE